VAPEEGERRRGREEEKREREKRERGREEEKERSESCARKGQRDKPDFSLRSPSC